MTSVDEFTAFHHAYNGISERRRRQQASVLASFCDHVGGDPIDVGAGAHELQAYLETLVARGLKPSTVGFYLKAIGPYFAWAQQTGRIDALRLAEIRLVKAPRGASTFKPKPYSQQQVKTLWRQLNADWPWSWHSPRRMKRGHDPGPSRTRGEHNWERWFTGPTLSWHRAKPYPERVQMEALTALLLGGGLRRIEAFGLTPRDVDTENAYMVVHGAAKNESGVSVDRAVPWTTSHMRDSMAEWLAVRERLAPGHDHLWLSLAHGWVTHPMPFDRFRNLYLMLGHGWEFHRLRHTAATEMLRAGYPIEKVQKILGHASIQMTMRYLELLPEDVVEIASRRESELSTVLRPPVEAR